MNAEKPSDELYYTWETLLETEKKIILMVKKQPSRMSDTINHTRSWKVVFRLPENIFHIRSGIEC